MFCSSRLGNTSVLSWSHHASTRLADMAKLPALSAWSLAARLAILTALSLLFLAPLPNTAAMEEDLAPATKGLESEATFETGTRLIDDDRLTRSIYYMRRHRTRYAPETDGYENNLNHSSLHANLDFTSGMVRMNVSRNGPSTSTSATSIRKDASKIPISRCTTPTSITKPTNRALPDSRTPSSRNAT